MAKTPKEISAGVRTALLDEVGRQAAELTSEANIGDMVKEPAKKIAQKAVNKETKAISKALNKETNKLLKGGFWERNMRRAKWGAAAVAAVGVLGGLAYAMRGSRKQAPQASDMVADADLNAAASMIQQPVEYGPADGRAPGEWASRIRGNAPQVAAQPAMTAVPGGSEPSVNTPSGRA